MRNITGYLIRSDQPYRGYTQSILYKDAEGVERVAYTGRARVVQFAGRANEKVMQEATPDLTLAEYEVENGAIFKRITEVELNALQAEHLASLATEPEPMDVERFEYLLEVLPPCRWATIAGAETFHISERLTGDLVQWCIRLPSGACYGMVQPASISKEHLAELVNNIKQ